MSYWLETQQEQIFNDGEIYYINCPYCEEEDIENIDECRMPWGIDDELRIECPHCKKNFEIRPKYKFEGFFIYSDDEQMENTDDNE